MVLASEEGSLPEKELVLSERLSSLVVPETWLSIVDEAPSPVVTRVRDDTKSVEWTVDAVSEPVTLLALALESADAMEVPRCGPKEEGNEEDSEDRMTDSEETFMLEATPVSEEAQASVTELPVCDKDSTENETRLVRWNRKNKARILTNFRFSRGRRCPRVVRRRGAVAETGCVDIAWFTSLDEVVLAHNVWVLSANKLS